MKQALAKKRGMTCIWSKFSRIAENQNFARTFKTAKRKLKKHVHEVYTDAFDPEDSSLVVFVLSVQHVNEVAS